MKGQHVDPEEAVQIHQDLQAKHSVAIHWGTFALAYEVRTETHHSLLPLPVGVELKGEGDGVGRHLRPSFSYPLPPAYLSPAVTNMQFYLEPPARLRAALDQMGLRPDSFFTLDHGESRLISSQDGDVFG